jgi:hypothetical protein
MPGIIRQMNPTHAFPAAAAAFLIFLMLLMVFIMRSFLAVHDRPEASGLGNKKGNVPSPYAAPGIPVCHLIKEAGKSETGCNAANDSSRSGADARTDGGADSGSGPGSAGGSGSAGSGLGGSLGKFGAGDFIPGVTHGIPGGFDGSGSNPDSVVSVFHGMFLLQSNS